MIEKVNQIRFLEKSFLVANIILEEVFGMSFFTLSNIDIDFLRQKL